MILSTSNPAISPAVLVASFSSTPKYAGQVITTFFTSSLSPSFPSSRRLFIASLTNLRRIYDEICSGRILTPLIVLSASAFPISRLIRLTTFNGSNKAFSFALSPTVIFSASSKYTTEGVVIVSSEFFITVALPFSSTYATHE